jgi:RNA polymerase primary sigma factor
MRQDVQKNQVAELAESLPEKSKKHTGKLTDAHRRLVASHMPLAYAMAWQAKNSGVCLDDLQQESCIGLCEAAMRYDENQQCCFATYARYWCQKMILKAIHREKATAETNADTLQDVADEETLSSGQQRRIDHALADLTPTERQIVTLYYGIGTPQPLSIAEAAAAMGFSKARASALHLQALQKLNTALAKRPLADYLSTWLP